MLLYLRLFENSLTWRCAGQVYSSVENLPLLPEKFGFASIARKVVTLLINQAIYLLKGVLALGSY